MTTVAGIRISNPDRVVYPEVGITKLDVVKYFESIGEWLLPHVIGRPLTLVHCPQGMTGECRFLKHSRLWGPTVIRRVRIQEKKKVGEYMVADTVAGVIGIAQMSVLEIHTWNSTTDDIEKPNRIVIDLDPGDRVAWKTVIASAQLVKKVLESIDLEAFVKTTGGRGLHVVVPVRPELEWNKCLEFSRHLADALVKANPNLYTTTFARAGRESKILLDYLRNNRTNTSISAYSTRARSGAPVSMPVKWSDLRSSLDPLKFNIETVPQLLVRARRDPWKDYWTTRQRLTTSMIKAMDAITP